MSQPESFSTGNAWYSDNGPENDVVLSTRVRFARNLANFPFPNTAKKDDCERILSLVYDAFAHLENPERYQCVGIDDIDFSARQLLTERGIIPEKHYSQYNLNAIGQDTSKHFTEKSGLVVRTDGRFSCFVNTKDHLHLASFVAGYDLQSAWQICRDVDIALQKKLQFAASYEFGFLTSSIKDVGSGMKISVRLILPGLLQTKKIKDLVEMLTEKNFSLQPVFGATQVPFGSLGSCYQLSTMYAYSGSEEDQLMDFHSVINYICNEERMARKDFFEEKPTLVKHLICKSYAVAKFSRFLECSETIDIISLMHLGIACNIVSGIDFNELHALMYRVRVAHLDYLRQNTSLQFEADVEKEIALMIGRLRAVLMQEALENVQIFT